MTRSIHTTTRRTVLATAAMALASSAFWAAGAAGPDLARRRLWLNRRCEHLRVLRNRGDDAAVAEVLARDGRDGMLHD